MRYKDLKTFSAPHTHVPYEGASVVYRVQKEVVLFEDLPQLYAVNKRKPPVFTPVFMYWKHKKNPFNPVTGGNPPCIGHFQDNGKWWINHFGALDKKETPTHWRALLY